MYVARGHSTYISFIVATPTRNLLQLSKAYGLVSKGKASINQERLSRAPRVSELFFASLSFFLGEYTTHLLTLPLAPDVATQTE